MHLQALLFGPMGAVSKGSRFPLIYLKVRFLYSFAYGLSRFKSILCLKVDSTRTMPRGYIVRQTHKQKSNINPIKIHFLSRI